MANQRKPRPVKAWAIVTPRGRIAYETMCETENACLWNFWHKSTLMVCGYSTRDDFWAGAKAKGYRCVRVRVEVDD